MYSPTTFPTSVPLSMALRKISPVEMDGIDRPAQEFCLSLCRASRLVECFIPMLPYPKSPCSGASSFEPELFDCLERNSYNDQQRGSSYGETGHVDNFIEYDGCNGDNQEQRANNVILLRTLFMKSVGLPGLNPG